MCPPKPVVFTVLDPQRRHIDMLGGHHMQWTDTLVGLQSQPCKGHWATLQSPAGLFAEFNRLGLLDASTAQPFEVLSIQETLARANSPLECVIL